MRKSIPSKAAVINEALVLRSLEEEHGEYERGECNGSKQEAHVQFHKLGELSLSFKHIYEIDNLQMFPRLTKLCLDNNKIEKIHNLETLVNLRWLDLSFNNIEIIEGLEMLTNLTDLSLFQNKVKDITGLSKCKKLNVLSLGNNRIESLNSLKTLRSFPCLQVVQLSGNPMCKDTDYKIFPLAFLKHLRYFDYQLVEQSSVVAAKEQFQDFLQDLEEKENLEEKSSEMEKSQGDHLSKIKAANLNVVDGLVETLLKDDTEHDKLLCLPFMAELVDVYQESYTSLAETFKSNILNLNKKMEDESSAFAVALKTARHTAVEEAVSLARSFDRKKKRLRNSVVQKTRNRAKWIEDITEIEGLNEKLRRRLYQIESDTRSDFDDLSTHFEIRYSEMKDKVLDSYQIFFRSIEDIENKHSEILTNKTAEIIQAYSKKDASPPDDKDLAILMQDKESLMSSVLTSNDIHVGKILAIEDEMRERLGERYKSLLRKIEEEETQRNRLRVSDIGKIYETNKSKIQEIRDLVRV